ncbi:MAG: DUF4340 domain-containing protein, partial [Myxococcota bacterium]
ASDDTDGAWTLPEDPPEPTIVEETERFVGNTAAQDMWERFAPFMADRELESTKDLDMGFDEPSATLTVERTSGDPVIVEFGGTTYGDRARYLRSNGRTFLVAKRALKSIEATDKLKERSLHPLSIADVQNVTVERDGTLRTFQHKNPDDRAKRFWVDVTEPNARDESATQWMPSLVRLGVQDYPSEAPTDLQPVFNASLTGDGKTWNVEVMSDGATPATWYAKSAYNRGVVELTASQVEEVIADLDDVMSTAEPAESPTPPSP